MAFAAFLVIVSGSAALFAADGEPTLDGIPGDGTPGSRGTGTATWEFPTGDGGNYKGFTPDVFGLWIDTTGYYPKSDFGALFRFNCFGCNGAGADTVAFAGAAINVVFATAQPLLRPPTRFSRGYASGLRRYRSASRGSSWTR